MNQAITEFVVIFGAAWALWKIIAELLSSADKILKDEFKQALGRRLQERKNDSSRNWSTDFITVFDSIFSSRFFSYRFIITTIVLSTAISLILVIASHLLHFGTLRFDLVTFDEEFGQSKLRAAYKTALIYPTFVHGSFWILIYTMYVTIIVDFLSIMKTRILLGYLSKSQRMTSGILIVVADLFTFAAIWIVVVPIVNFLVLLFILLINVSPHFQSFTGAFFDAFTVARMALALMLGDIWRNCCAPLLHNLKVSFREDDLFWPGAFLYSSLFLSAWCALFFLSLQILRGYYVVVRTWGHLITRNVIDVRAQPLQTISFLTLIIILSGAVIVFAFRLIVRI